MKKYHHIVVGGTFDHLHAGHMSLIDHAFKLGSKVTIGLATDCLLSEKLYRESIESYDVRKEYIYSYIKRVKINQIWEVVPLNDIYGIAGDDPTVEAIVVTQETRANAVKINCLRAKNGLPLLTIVTIPFVLGTDRKIIRSSRIRSGNVDRDGLQYIYAFNKKVRLALPSHLRESLRIPLGHIISGTDDSLKATALDCQKFLNEICPFKVITVGDIATVSLQSVNQHIDVAIIDFKTKRSIIETSSPFPKKDYVINSPGSLHQSAIRRLYKTLNTKVSKKMTKYMYVRGEEDLLTLPAILLSPLGAVVMYGQHNIGIIVVHVTEEIKSKVRDLLNQFV